MGRMNSNHIRTVTASAVSQISGPLDCEPSCPASHERLKRNRRGRKMNLPADDSRNTSTTSGEYLSRNTSSKSSSLSSSGRSASNSPSIPEIRNTYSQGAYAGAKFGDSPSARSLPPPPVHWISGGMLQTPVFGSCLSLTSELKTLLQVA